MIKLTDEQINAITHDGNVLLKACPGSGKTLVLIHKLAYEIGKLDILSKKRVVGLTFTNRASDEIERRLSKLGMNDKRIWTGTLHSFCLEWIIKPYSCYIPQLRNGFHIADEIYCQKLISDLKRKHGLNTPIATRINIDGSFIERGVKERKLLLEYQNRLKEDKCIDFDMLVFLSYQLINRYPNIATILSNIIKIICVDEYQDTQCLLYAIISTIVVSGNGCTSIFLFGDTDQAIYGSLGGLAKTIEEIRNDIHPYNITPLSLTGNYRSTQRIVDYNKNFQTSKIEIKSVGENSNERGIIVYNHSLHESELSKEIALIIMQNMDRGIEQNEICVLVPQWWMVSKITSQLRSILPEVDFDASGLSQFFKNRDNVWYKFTRLLLTQPSPRLYSLRLKWSREFIETFNMHTGLLDVANAKEERRILKIINSIESNETDIKNYFSDCFKQFLRYEDIDIANYNILNEAWIRFFSNLDDKLSNNRDGILRDVDYFKRLYKEKKGVVVNTCMGIKGEEFDTVISCGLLQGYVPHWDEINKGNEIESSRKLLYVVCSRSRQNLYLISETGRQRNQFDPTRELIKVKWDYDSYN